MNNIISATKQITKWIVAIDRQTDLTGQPDNVYPFDGVEDQWAVVIGQTQIAWAAEYSTACMIYITALQTRREHAERCPQDRPSTGSGCDIPFDGTAPATDEWSDDYAIPAVTL